MNRKAHTLLLFLLAAVLAFSVTACGSRQQDKNLQTSEGDTNTTDICDTDEETSENETGTVASDAATEDTDTEDDALTKEPEAGMTEENGEDTGSGTEERVTPKRIGIYTIDEETLETVSLTAVVNVADGLTADAVVEAVKLALEDHSIEIQVTTAVTGQSATVDIQAENPVLPFGNAGSAVESVILDCISYSLFDNFEEINEVYFTVNGGEYESGHIYLPVGEPYLTK